MISGIWNSVDAHGMSKPVAIRVGTTKFIQNMPIDPKDMLISTKSFSIMQNKAYHRQARAVQGGQQGRPGGPPLTQEGSIGTRQSQHCRSMSFHCQDQLQRPTQPAAPHQKGARQQQQRQVWLKQRGGRQQEGRSELSSGLPQHSRSAEQRHRGRKV